MLHPEMARAKGQTLKLGSQIVAEFAPEHFPGRPPALLGTPRATEYKGTGPVGSPSHEDWLRKHYLTAQAQEITKTLPTPKAGDSNLGTPSTSGRPVEKSTHLSTIVALQSGLLEHRRDPEKFLRTPTAKLATMGGSQHPDRISARGQTVSLKDQVEHELKPEKFQPTPNTMDVIEPREGEAIERQLRRGGEGSRRSTSGNLREDILLTVDPDRYKPQSNGESMNPQFDVGSLL